MFDSQLHSLRSRAIKLLKRLKRTTFAFKQMEWIHVWAAIGWGWVLTRPCALSQPNANCQSFIGKRIAYKPILVLALSFFYSYWNIKRNENGYSMFAVCCERHELEMSECFVEENMFYTLSVCTCHLYSGFRIHLTNDMICEYLLCNTL